MPGASRPSTYSFAPAGTVNFRFAPIGAPSEPTGFAIGATGTVITGGRFGWYTLPYTACGSVRLPELYPCSVYGGIPTGGPQLDP